MEIVASPNNRSRAAHYVRMSTEHQQYSPENQADIIRQYAANHNMEIVQVYSDLPKGFQNYHIPLGDRHLPLLQSIPSTPSFALITVLSLTRRVSDETSHALKTLHGLCTLDISQTSISHLGIRHFAPTITSEPSDAHYGTRGLRILRLCNCPKITDQVIDAVSNFQLLTILGSYHL